MRVPHPHFAHQGIYHILCHRLHFMTALPCRNMAFNCCSLQALPHADVALVLDSVSLKPPLYLCIRGCYYLIAI